MSDVNRIVLEGTVGQDPEVRKTGGGRKVVNITVSTAYNDKLQWHRVVIWGVLAKYAREHLRKGSRVKLEGRMDYREWVDRSNVSRVSAEISVNSIHSMSENDRGSQELTAPPMDYEVNGNI